MDGRLGGRRRAGAGAGRIALPERRRKADRSLDRARRRPGRAPAPAAAEHDSLDQVRSRSTAKRRATAAGLDRDLARRPLQADQQRAVRERLPRVHLPLLAVGADAARPPGARRPLPGSVERDALARAPAGARGAAGTRGSSPTTRFRAATRTGRTRRHFRRGCPSTACASTGCRGLGVVADPFLGLGSTAVACAPLGVISSGSSWTRTI